MTLFRGDLSVETIRFRATARLEDVKIHSITWKKVFTSWLMVQVGKPIKLGSTRGRGRGAHAEPRAAREGVSVLMCTPTCISSLRACPCASSFRGFPRHRCCGLIASFPGPCASSGGRLPAALFMVFQLDSKGANALPGPLAGPASPLVARLSFELGLALACVRASDALRCVPARRVLTLSRIHGFHLYVILPSQPFLFVRVFGKNGKKGLLTGFTQLD